jgi:rhamnulokinase
MEKILGQKFDVIHVVGGGAQNRLLNQLTADACGRPVVAGPGEATALGNAIGQLVASGAVANWNEARQVSRRSSPTETYAPQPDAVARWQGRAEHLD